MFRHSFESLCRHILSALYIIVCIESDQPHPVTIVASRDEKQQNQLHQVPGGIEPNDNIKNTAGSYPQGGTRPCRNTVAVTIDSICP